MPRFPGYGPPSQFYKPYNYRPPTPTPTPNPVVPIEKVPAPPAKPLKSHDPIWLDLFGIKLYFDDVLILSLLFFLYKEDVKDQYLLLVLVLLLLS